MPPPQSCYQALARALQRSWRRYQGCLAVSSKGAKRGPVHDLRTSLRRLIALIDVMQELRGPECAAELRKELKRELATLGDLRDLQTQEKAATPGHFREALQKRIRKQQQQAERTLVGVAIKRQSRNLMSEAAQLLVQAENPFAEKRARKCLERRLLESFRYFASQAQLAQAALPSSFHRARIAFKKFRYTWEALAPIFPLSPATKVGLKETQDILGEIQDTVVLIALLLEHLVESQRTEPSEKFLQRLHAAEQRQDLAIARFIEDRTRLLREIHPHPAQRYLRAG